MAPAGRGGPSRAPHAPLTLGPQAAARSPARPTLTRHLAVCVFIHRSPAPPSGGPLRGVRVGPRRRVPLLQELLPRIYATQTTNAIATGRRGLHVPVHVAARVGGRPAEAGGRARHALDLQRPRGGSLRVRDHAAALAFKLAATLSRSRSRACRACSALELPCRFAILVAIRGLPQLSLTEHPVFRVRMEFPTNSPNADLARKKSFLEGMKL